MKNPVLPPPLLPPQVKSLCQLVALWPVQEAPGRRDWLEWRGAQGARTYGWEPLRSDATAPPGGSWLLRSSPRCTHGPEKRLLTAAERWTPPALPARLGIGGGSDWSVLGRRLGGEGGTGGLGTFLGLCSCPVFAEKGGKTQSRPAKCKDSSLRRASVALSYCLSAPSGLCPRVRGLPGRGGQGRMR